MLADFFAPANLATTLLCMAALAAAGVIQYRLCLASVRVWLRRLPVLLCSGAAVLFLILFFALLSSKAWYALSCLFAMLLMILLLIACAIGYIAARCKQHRINKRTPHT